MEKDNEISNLKNSNNKDIYQLKEKYKKNIEKELTERNLIEIEKKKEKEVKISDTGKTKTKSIKRGDIEPNMTLKSAPKKSIRYNYKD